MNYFSFRLLLAVLFSPLLLSAQGQGGGGKGGGPRSPILTALDTNGDREISEDEMENARRNLLSLDTNENGQLEAGEFRLDPASSGGNMAPQPNKGAEAPSGRTPWMLVHALELDADGNGIVEFESELMAEVALVFKAYDKNGDQKVTPEESAAKGGMPRSALGGFVREHATELDKDRDGGISKTEMTAQFARFFGQADKNGDNRLTADEYTVEGGVTPRFPEKMKPSPDSPDKGTAQAPPADNLPNKLWLAVHAEAVDINGDGDIRLDELMNQARMAFLAFDADGNGVVAREEYIGNQPRQAVAGYLIEETAGIDADANGLLTAKEFAGALREQFQALDKNGDSRIDPAELSHPVPPTDQGQAPEAAPSAPPSEPTPIPAPSSFPAGTASNQPAREGAPNIVLFLIDDMGWNAMGFSGNEMIETPRTDEMARQGMIFTNAYASAPNCAPTRACLMSGQYPPRHGVYTVVDDRHTPGSPHHKVLAAQSNAELATESVTIAEALKAGGYATGMFGMWNLGRGRDGPTTPTGQGFDVFKQPRDVGFDKDRFFNDKGQYLTDELTTAGIEWMSDQKDQPFFLYMAYHAVHSPFEPKPELVEKYRKKSAQDPDYAATVEATDFNVGRIIDALREKELSDNTLVIFHSDNGGTRQYIQPLAGGKGTVYEGGLRVPTAVWGPGVVQGTTDEPMLSMDIYPTVLDFAGLEPPANHLLDGESLAPLLTGTSSRLNRDRVFWHFPSYIGGGGPSSAMRQGDWKVIEKFESQTYEVYDLSRDPEERTNLADSTPEAEELINTLRAWQMETGAPRPTGSNPNFDPSAEPKKGRDQRGKKNAK
ncbi:MAG: sulfatase-like hydrolase/transferase [Verrucomicrobiales bacterium]